MSADVVDLDPRTLDSFTSVDDQVCQHALNVMVGEGQLVWLACEVEGEHDEHEATVRWKAEPAEETDE